MVRLWWTTRAFLLRCIHARSSRRGCSRKTFRRCGCDFLLAGSRSWRQHPFLAGCYFDPVVLVRVIQRGGHARIDCVNVCMRGVRGTSWSIKEENGSQEQLWGIICERVCEKMM